MNSWAAWGPCAPEQGGPGSPCSRAQSGEHLAAVINRAQQDRNAHSQPCSLLRSTPRCWAERQFPKLTEGSSWGSRQQGLQGDSKAPAGTPWESTAGHHTRSANNCLAQRLRTKSMFDWAKLQVFEKQGNNLAGEGAPETTPETSQSLLLLLRPSYIKALQELLKKTVLQWGKDPLL